MTGVVDPDVDGLKVMHCQAEHSIDFFAMTNIASKAESAIEIADPPSSGLDSACIAREENDSCSRINECSRDRFSYAHGGAGDNSNFARDFHAVLVFRKPCSVKLWRTIRESKSRWEDQS